MKRRVWKSSAAVRDLVEIAARLADDNLERGLRFLDGVEQSLAFLVGMPEAGGVYETDNPRLQELRVWRVRGFKKYLIFYRLSAARIDVIRILHGARDIAAIFDDDS